MGAISSLSTENVWFQIEDQSPSGPYDPTTEGVSLAFTDGSDPEAGDWKTGAWESGTVEIEGVDYHLATVLVGPGSPTILAKGFYSIFIKIGTTNPLISKGSVLQVY